MKLARRVHSYEVSLAVPPNSKTGGTVTNGTYSSISGKSNITGKIIAIIERLHRTFYSKNYVHCDLDLGDIVRFPVIHSLLSYGAMRKPIFCSVNISMF